MPKKPREGKSFSIYLDFAALKYIDNLVEDAKHKNRSAAVCATIHRVMKEEHFDG